MSVQLRLQLETPEIYRFEEFVSGPDSAEALAALAAFPHGVSPSLGLWGPEGCGKTHLLSALAHRLNGVYLTPAQAPAAELQALEGRVVCVDDADQIDDDTLFHLFNMSGAGGGALALASRRHPRDWRVRLPDLASRLNGLVCYALPIPSDEALEAILTRQLVRRSIAPSADLIDYLAKRIERSGAAAKHIVERLDQESGARPITRRLARDILDNRATPDDTEEKQ